MRRRTLLGSALALPAVPALLPAQTQAAAESAKLNISSPDSAGEGIPRFFSADQLAMLKRLADTIIPAHAGRPSASQAAVAEFLDFLISQSPPGTQKLYRDGLDRLIGDGLSDSTLAPLREPWTYHGPPDAFARFLQQVKQDILQAALNSREWAEAATQGRRSGVGLNYYYRSLD